MTNRRNQVAHALFAVAFVAAGVAVVLPASPTAAKATDGSFTKSVTATRVFVDENGNETTASSNQVKVTVSQTKDVRGRQEVHVAWEGAVPTGGVVSDPNTSDGRNEEYPFVLLQCRGVDTTGTAPKGQVKLSPETCWTQTSPERYIAAASHTPAWRFDAFAAAADRGAVVGAPDPLPDPCAELSEPLTARWLPFRAADGQVYYGGPDPNVGCSVDVSCALVAVPIVGISCDAWGTRLPADSPQATRVGDPLTDSQRATADATCRKTGAYQPGESKSSQTSDQAVRGNLWWSASNWRNRVTVPLTFAATGAAG